MTRLFCFKQDRTETNAKQPPYDKRSKKMRPLDHQTQFTHQFEEVSSFDTFKYDATSDYEVRNDFKDIRTKAFKVRRKIYEQDIKQKETQNHIQVKCNDNVVQSLNPESINVTNKSIDEKTKKFSTLSKRIQRDRQHCNYDGYFENYIKNDAKEKDAVTLYTSIKRFLKNFKAHRYKDCSQDGNITKQNKNTNSLSSSKYSLFSHRKRRKKKNFTDYFEDKSAAIFTFDSPEIIIERKINCIDICNSEFDTDTNGLSEGLYNERCYLDKTITNWNKLEDEDYGNNKTTVNYYGNNESTDLTYNITYYTGLTVDQHEHKNLDEKKNCNKDCRKSSFNTSLCYFFQSFIHHFGSRNKISPSSERRHQTYMIMNFEKSDVKRDYNMKPTTLSDISPKTINPHLKDIENSRNYRLSSYLAERDWMVKHNEYRNYLKSGLQRLLSISEGDLSVPSVRFYIHLTHHYHYYSRKNFIYVLLGGL